MADSSRKWLLGCGIGCGALALIAGILVAGSVFFFRGVVEEFQETQASMDAVTSRHGSVTAFGPAPDGTIPPERLEAFLAVRDAMTPVRDGLEQTLGLLADGERGRMGSPAKMLRMVRAGVGMLQEIADYYRIRNEQLLAHGMGLGEYTYIYTLAYYSWLGKSVADGPPFRLIGGENHADGYDEFDVREERRERILSQAHGALLPMLRNQLARPDETGSEGSVHWRQSLAAEVAALEADPYRIAWQDGLPEPLDTSLRPFRNRLEQSYSVLCNALELGPGVD